MESVSHNIELDNKHFTALGMSLDGEVMHDKLNRAIYSTDASVYRAMPLAVVYPKNKEDIRKVILFAQAHKLSLIPRAGGTSLAGQCVGNGIVVDVSKYMTRIYDLDLVNKTIRVQPGVIRDELNQFLEPYNLFFSPITSTANRATIGGMVGNNSCGTTSITYGSTRDHLLEVHGILADGSDVVFRDLTALEVVEKCNQDNLEGKIYNQLTEALKDPIVVSEIQQEYPKKSIHRRNTGYAIDLLLENSFSGNSDNPFNLCKIIAGSEGTLVFITDIKIHIDDIPPPYHVVIASHFHELLPSLKAVQLAMKHNPTACELMDKIILDCTKANREQRNNRFFVDGDPAAILSVEFKADSEEAALSLAQMYIEDMKQADLGYAHPIISGSDTSKIWKLRSAGLGLLANIPGEAKAVACIEDTSVSLEDLPNYIEEVSAMLSTYGQETVYYAHAGAGEIHMRPVLNLKNKKDVKKFYDISLSTAQIVKKYGGSLSGEHGDGIVRAPFIPLMIGEKNYNLLKEIKYTWDPNNVFNPGKIVDAHPMTESLRYTQQDGQVAWNSVFDFSEVGGILSAAEKCNGSGDCRKLPLSGGTMCPSYHATKEEKDTTRARANALRELLTTRDGTSTLTEKEVMAAMDLCLSCKACSSECPSNVDMTILKAEFLNHYYSKHKKPLRSKIFSHFYTLTKFGSKFPSLSNASLKIPGISFLLKKIMGVAPERDLPTFSKVSVKKWYKRNKNIAPQKPIKTIYLFCDEFTEFNEAEIGIKAISLLWKLGYDVTIIDHEESGRAAFSKGFLTKAKSHAVNNVKLFSPLISSESPLLGIEPSAILSFTDEYPKIVGEALKKEALNLAQNAMMIESFLVSELQAGHISQELFHSDKKSIHLHGHCHQKATGKIEDTLFLLSYPSNYEVNHIPSGCCGMAGSFGYEKEHYNISQKIGETILFPTIRNLKASDVICANGTSCRVQILDGTSRKSHHIVEILYDALIK